MTFLLKMFLPYFETMWCLKKANNERMHSRTSEGLYIKYQLKYYQMYNNMKWISGSLEVEGREWGNSIDSAYDHCGEKTPRGPCRWGGGHSPALDARPLHNPYYYLYNHSKICIFVTFRILKGNLKVALPPNPTKIGKFPPLMACWPKRRVLFTPGGKKANTMLSKLAQNNTQDVQNGAHDLLQPCFSFSFFYFDEQDHQPLKFLKPNGSHSWLHSHSAPTSDLADSTSLVSVEATHFFPSILQRPAVFWITLVHWLVPLSPVLPPSPFSTLKPGWALENVALLLSALPVHHVSN